MDMKSFLEGLGERFDVLSFREQRKQLWHLDVTAKEMRSLLMYLHSMTGFVQLNHMTAVDWIEDNEFQMIYLMTDPVARMSIMVNLRIDRDEPTIDSIHDIWPVAITYEQEIHEGFGINFPGSPRQGKPYALDDGWDQLPPMRRDFDTLKYAEEAMGFRPGREHIDPKTRVAEYAKQKGYLND